MAVSGEPGGLNNAGGSSYQGASGSVSTTSGKRNMLPNGEIRNHNNNNNPVGGSAAGPSPPMHNGILENINRPSSRNAGSRKGTRARKGNTAVGSSHSQDSRPTLPQVHSLIQKS